MLLIPSPSFLWNPRSEIHHGGVSESVCVCVLGLRPEVNGVFYWAEQAQGVGLSLFGMRAEGGEQAAQSHHYASSRS